MNATHTMLRTHTRAWNERECPQHLHTSTIHILFLFLLRVATATTERNVTPTTATATTTTPTISDTVVPMLSCAEFPEFAGLSSEKVS